MPGGDDLDEARARYYSTLYDGPQPSAEPSPQMPDAPDESIPRGKGRTLASEKSAMSATPPVGLAQIFVCQQAATFDGQPQFGLKVRCYCTDEPLKDLEVTYGRPNLDPGTNLVPGGTQPRAFLRRMDSWSYEKTELAQWLSSHRHQDQVELVIKDDTRYRIPWELFWVPSYKGFGLPAGPLGAVLTVTRWVRVDSYWPQFVQEPENPPRNQVTGSVLAYVADEFRADRDVLSRFD